MFSGEEVVFENVCFSYSGKWVLENVNLTVKTGDFATIVGPNGGGKTTLLKLMLGLLKPERGRIRVFGGAPEKARLKIGYMPQHALFDAQFPVSVRDVVLMGRLGSGLGGRYTTKDRKVAAASLGEVNLEGFGERLFSELSGGQKQRVLIARALSCEPDLLLLDEPTANVDPAVGENLLHILKKLNRHMTILLVSHDLGFVSKVVKSVICVNRVVVVHPTSDIDGAVINEIYGGDLRMIRHDHRCSEGGHLYD